MSRRFVSFSEDVLEDDGRPDRSRSSQRNRLLQRDNSIDSVAKETFNSMDAGDEEESDRMAESRALRESFARPLVPILRSDSNYSIRSQDSGPFEGPLVLEEMECTRNAILERFFDVQFDREQLDYELIHSPPWTYLNPYSRGNAGMALSYLNIGIATTFLNNPVAYYLINTLNVNATQYSAFSTLISLPWSLKFLYGMLSDSVPIRSYKRKSWMLIGWVAYAAINLILAWLQTPSFLVTTVAFFLTTNAFILADVCTDTMCVERGKYELEEIAGTLQTAGFTVRAFGYLLGSILGAVLFNSASWGWGLSIAQLFILSACFPLGLCLPFLWDLVEIGNKRGPIPRVKQHLHVIWSTLQLKAVWWPMLFIYVYNLLQVPNSAWTNFLVTGLKFSDFDLGLITIASNALYWVGMLIYKQFFFDASWRDIYIVTTCIGALFSIFQVLLVLRVNVSLGIPDLVFAIGDAAIAVLMNGLQSMPSKIMFMMICPEGSEGVTFALLTTVQNIASIVGIGFGSVLTLQWNVSNSDIEAGDYSGVLKLTILTSVLHILPLALVWILPDTKEEQRQLRDSGESSRLGGAILAAVIVISIVTTLFVNVYLIIF